MPAIPPQLLDESVLRRLLDESPMLFVALTGLGEIVWMSESNAALIGRPPAELVGTNILDLIHPDDHATVIGSMVAAPDEHGRPTSVEIRVVRSSAGWSHLEIGGIDLRDDTGEGLYLAWGRTLESTSRLAHFMTALASGATLADLVTQILAWFSASSRDHTATISVRRGDAFVAVGSGPPDAEGLHVTFVPSTEPSAPWDRALTDAATHTTHAASAEGLEGLPLPIRTVAEARGVLGVSAVPVSTTGADEPSALLVVWQLDAGEPAAAHRRRVETAAQFLQLALEWSASHAALVAAATTDELTGLANRAQLTEVIRTDRSPLAAVLFCDLDDFKVVNDRHGHLVGDRLLQEAARRLGAAVRPTDLLARLGGDEFAVFCPDLTSAAESEAVAARMVAALDVPIELGGRSHRVGCSVGVAVVGAEDRGPNDVDVLLGAADRALYRAKAAGKGRWVRATPEHDSRLPFPE